MRSTLPPTLLACAILALLTVAGGSSPAHGQAHYPLLWDPALSSETGAENLATAHRGLMALEDRVLPLRWTDERTVGEKALGVTYRLGRAVLLDGTIAYLAALTQHEVHGHGAGARQTGSYGSRYELRFPPPYGPGGGLTDYPDDVRFGPYESLHATANGVNGTLQLFRTVRDHAVLRGRVYHDEVLLGLAGHLDLPTYVWKTSRPAEDFNDIVSYLSAVAPRFGSGTTPTLSSLRTKALVSLLDPFALFALRSSLVDYLFRGTPSTPLRALEWRGIRYLPSIHLSLSPFGPEFLLEHLAVHHDRLWRLSTRLGNGPYGRFGGAGLRVSNLVHTDRLHTDARLDVWYQPTLLFNDSVRRAYRQSDDGIDPFALGGRAEISASIRPTTEWPVFATGTVGYKTEGFVLGEGLDDGILVEFGLRLEADLLE